MTEEQKRVALMSPGNGSKMLELGNRVDGELDAYLRRHAEMQEAELISRVNMTLYNLAQSHGISLWKLCFEIMPQWEVSDQKLEASAQGGDVTLKIDYDMHLVPIVIDWEHGPSYWEKKYRELKERVAGFLNEEDQFTDKTE